MVWVSMPLSESTTTMPNVSNGIGAEEMSRATPSRSGVMLERFADTGVRPRASSR